MLVSCETILLRVNINKVAGPDNMPGYILKWFADQCANVSLSSLHQKSLTALWHSSPSSWTALLVLQHIKDNMLASQDPHQQLCSSTALHSVFMHLNYKKKQDQNVICWLNLTHWRLCDWKTSHASHACVQHLTTTGYSTSSQTVQIGSCTSSLLVLNNEAPQGCVLSPLLFTLYNHKGRLSFACNPCAVKWQINKPWNIHDKELKAS